MRSFDAPTLAQFQARSAISARVLVWVVARNRGTDLPESLGLCTGAQDAEFTINGTPRMYYGAGPLLDVPLVVSQVGLGVRMQRVVLSPLSDPVADLIRTYDSRFAAVEIHRALFDPVTGLLVAEPHRLFKGIIDEMPVTRDAKSGENKCDVSLASSSRYLTRTLPLKRSDASMKLRSGDRFLRFADVSGEVDVYWGEKRESESSAPTPPPLPRLNTR